MYLTCMIDNASPSSRLLIDRFMACKSYLIVHWMFVDDKEEENKASLSLEVICSPVFSCCIYFGGKMWYHTLHVCIWVILARYYSA